MRVRGIDDKDLEGFDSTHTFVLNAKPEPPFPVVPQPGGSVPVGHAEFSWSKSEGISTYHFQLADNKNFDQPVVNITNYKGKSVLIKESLEPGQWYWRVAAIDPEEGSGPFGEANSFRVMKPGPEAAPPEMSENEIVFRWPATEASDQYQFQVAREDTFETPLVDERLTESQYILPVPEQPGTIYMRTKVIEADGFEGSWSTPQSLEIPAKPPVWMLGIIPFLFML
jgi:nitrogen fixation protein FixH